MDLVSNKSNTMQAFWVALGNFLSTCIMIGCTMLLTRYMDKHDYGTYKQVFYVYGTITTVFTLGLPRAYGYFLPKVTIGEGKDIASKITKLFLFLGALLALLLVACSSLLASLLNNEDLRMALILFSPVPLFLLPTMGLESIYATYKKTHLAAIYMLVSRILILLFVVLPIMTFSSDYKVAIGGFTIASFISFLLAFYLKNTIYKGVEKKSSFISVKQILAYCIPIMLASVFNTIINSTDPFFISRYFGTEKFAEFSNGAMELPFVGMIMGACGTVLLPLYSSISKSENLSNDNINDILRLWNSVIEKTVMLVYPIIIFCIFFATDIMVLLYGCQYEESGLYFFIMLFNNFFAVFSVVPIILALNKTRQYTYTFFFNCVLLIVLEFVVVELTNSLPAICVISVACLWLRTLMLLNIVSKTLNISIGLLIPKLVVFKITLLSVVLLLIIRQFFEYVRNIANNLSAIIVCGIIFVLAMIIASRLFKLDYIGIIKPIIHKC